MNAKLAIPVTPRHPHGGCRSPSYLWGRPASMYVRALRRTKRLTT
jgi:hypothetical protein